jgi:hypothetical protein
LTGAVDDAVAAVLTLTITSDEDRYDDHNDKATARAVYEK